MATTCVSVAWFPSSNVNEVADKVLSEKGVKGLLAQLPPDVRKTLEDCDRRGDHESEEFQKASKVFISRYVCTLDPMPEEIMAGFKNMSDDPTVYITM